MDGDPLSYQWTVISKPPNSAAVLSNPNAVRPTFVVDAQGSYTFQLVVNDGVQNSAPSNVTVTTQNSAPVANAGPAQKVAAGATVQLDGSGSTDVDGDRLTYSWSLLSVPQGSVAAISTANAITPTFVADLNGTYVVQLIVNDGTTNSAPATVLITTGNTPPVANAGLAQTVAVGSQVALDGTASSDVDGDPLSFSWSILSVPSGSGAVLGGATTPHPTFGADLTGDYVIQLIVNDGTFNSAPTTVVISTINSQPVANAGPRQNIIAGTTVTLDGSGSFDADHNALTYTWSLLALPSGSTAALSNPHAVKPTFVADLAGQYIAQLILNDGQVSSVPATVLITAAPQQQPPVVSAGPNQTIELPVNSVTLNGSAVSIAPAGSPVAVQWSEVSGPGTISFASPNSQITQATFPLAGTYVVQLTGTVTATGLSSSATATITVAPVNQPPVVTVGPDQTITYPTNSATLTGTATDDGYPVGSTLAISWSVLSGPGTITFSNPFQPNTQATFSQAGNYVLQLSASDSQYSAAGTLRVTYSSPAGGGITVNAGANQVIAMPNPATLNGSASDSNPPSGSTLSVSWTQVSGPGIATFANANLAGTTATFSDVGVYVLRLTATNGTYTASSDTTIYAGQVQCVLSNESTDFWIMFIGAEVLDTDPSRQISLYISSAVATSGTVSVPGQGLNFPFTVTPGQVTTVILPQSVQMTTSDTVESKGIHITSQNPIAVYGLNFVPAATDGFMALPTATLGTSYINLGYNNGSAGIPDVPNALGTEFGITATQDGTTVTIVPTANAGARGVRQAYSVSLNQGQTYQLRNNRDLSTFTNSGSLVDLSGSIITSDKPVAVFGGNDCAFVPNQNAFCNHLVEQLPPTNLWGQHFVSYPITQDRNGDTYRFLAQTDNTQVQLNGQQIAQINHGEFFETVVKGAAQIDANQPILVAEYANSSTFSGTSNTDPTMILIPPFESFGGGYTVNTPTSNFPTNYLNVVAATSAAQAGSITLDGTALPGSAFQQIGTSPFSGAQVSASVGPHTLASPLPFGVYAYGFNQYDNYGYSGGVCLAKGVTGSTLVASPKTSNAPVTSQVCLQAKVTDPSGNPIGGTGVTFKVAGVNSTTGFVTTDATGIATFCYMSTVTGSDLVTITAGNASDTASVTWVSNGPNQPPVVSAGPNLTISLPTNSALLNGSVLDDGLPVGGTVTQSWSEISGPTAVSFATPTQPQTSATFSQAGTYVLQLTASDSQLTSSAKTTVIVYPPNQPPVVSAGPDQSFMWFGAQGTYLSGTVTDDGLPAGSTLTINWTTISGPSPISSFYPPNSAVTLAQFPYPGTYVAELSANDTQFTTTSFVTIHAFGPVTTNLTPSSSLAIDAGTSSSLDAGVLVGGQPPAQGIPLKIQWGVFAGPSGSQVTFGSPNSSATTAVFSAPGSYQLVLNLTDANRNNIGVQACCLNVNVAPAGTQAPTVSLVTPADGSEITSPTSVIGNVSDGNWTLEYSVANDLTPQPFFTIATGTGAVANASVGTLDPTLLLNGTYTIRLRSTNASELTGAAAVTVNVTRNMKIGVFTLSFNDLTVPLPGLPVQVIRTYDSRDKSTGDFGVGWHMSIANLRLQKNHNLGLAWQETVTFPGEIPQYCLQPTIPTIVTITFPDGKVYRFQTTVAQTCQPAGPISADTLTFTQIPTSSNTAGASLVPQDGGAVLVDGSIPGPVHLDGYDGNTYNPTQFKLTTADGTVYFVDQRLGATSVRDTNGNVLTIMVSGITHSSGRGVIVDRDIQGRVTRINDPNGNSMYYAYDQNGNLITYTDRQTNATAFTYDPSHNLTGITLPNGTSGLANTYDPTSGRLSATKDALGFSTSFTPNLTAQTETIRDRNGYGTTYTYDNDGNVVQTTDPLGHVSSATYDSSDNKLTETNALGKTTTYTYDSFGNKLTEADPLQHQTAYTYNVLQRVLTVKDANQHTTTNTYDGNGNLLTTTDANQKTTTNTYGPGGLPATTKDPLGNTTSFVYDGNGNLTQQTDALNNVSTYTYDANGNRTSQTVTRTLPATQGGGTQTLTTQYRYDGLNRLVKTIYPDGAATQVVYNNLGQQSTTIDALGNKTGYTYDADGHLTQTNYPDGASESYTYDNNGNRVRFFPREGNVTLYTYDPLNRLTQSQVGSNPSSAAITTTVYDAAGQVTSTKDPNGNVTQYIYDDAGRRTQVTNALNQITTYAYDAAGNQTSMTDALTHTTTYVYDAVNRRTQVIYPDTTSDSTGYDALGRVLSHTDANAKLTAYSYDGLGRLTSVTQDAASGGLNLVTQYTYDEVGNRLTQTDANNHTTSYQYDQRGRRTLRALPLGQTETSVYDANGNMTFKTDFNGRTTAYTYEKMNRLLSKTADPYFAQNHIGASQVTFTYTPSGKRSSMNDASGFTSYRYDGFDRLSQIFNPEGSASYTYDLAGNLTAIFGPSGAHYYYDGLNRLGAVQWQVGNNQVFASYGYDAAGNLQTVTYPNGVVHNYSYDQNNRLTNLAVNNTSGPIASYAYTLDPAGHRTKVTELSGRTVQYGYDSLYRLTSETISGSSSQNGAISYVYDPVGNRQSMSSTVPAVPAGTFFYDANDRRGTDVYDADGNTVGSGGLSYVYDFENHLVQQGGATFVYDGDGNRVQKIVAGNVRPTTSSIA